VESVAKRKKHETRSDKVRTSQFVQKVQGIIDEDPSKSIRAIGKDFQVSECTVRRIDTTTPKQVKISSDMLWFFSDKKNFDQDQKTNRRNDRRFCADSSDVLRVMHTKFPATVMVLEVVSNKGHVMPPHFFLQGLRVNAAAYIDALETVVKP